MSGSINTNVPGQGMQGVSTGVSNDGATKLKGVSSGVIGNAALNMMQGQKVVASSQLDTRPKLAQPAPSGAKMSAQADAKNELVELDALDSEIKKDAALLQKALHNNEKLSSEQRKQLNEWSSSLDDSADHLATLQGKGLDKQNNQKKFLASMGQFKQDEIVASGDKAKMDAMLKTKFGSNLPTHIKNLKALGYNESQIKMMLLVSPGKANSMLQGKAASSAENYLKNLGYNKAQIASLLSLSKGGDPKQLSADNQKVLQSLMAKMGISSAEAKVLLATSDRLSLQNIVDKNEPGSESKVKDLKNLAFMLKEIATEKNSNLPEILDQMGMIYEVLALLHKMGHKQREFSRLSRQMAYDSAKTEIENQAQLIKDSALKTMIADVVMGGVTIAGAGVSAFMAFRPTGAKAGGAGAKQPDAKPPLSGKNPGPDGSGASKTPSPPSGKSNPIKGSTPAKPGANPSDGGKFMAQPSANNGGLAKPGSGVGGNNTSGPTAKPGSGVGGNNSAGAPGKFGNDVGGGRIGGGTRSGVGSSSKASAGNKGNNGNGKMDPMSPRYDKSPGQLSTGKQIPSQRSIDVKQLKNGTFKNPDGSKPGNLRDLQMSKYGVSEPKLSGPGSNAPKLNGNINKPSGPGTNKVSNNQAPKTNQNAEAQAGSNRDTGNQKGGDQNKNNASNKENNGANTPTGAGSGGKGGSGGSGGKGGKGGKGQDGKKAANDISKNQSKNDKKKASKDEGDEAKAKGAKDKAAQDKAAEDAKADLEANSANIRTQKNLQLGQIATQFTNAAGTFSSAGLKYWAAEDQAKQKESEARQKFYENVAQSSGEMMQNHQDLTKNALSAFEQIERSNSDTLKSMSRA